MIIAGLVALTLSSGLLVPIADGPPRFDIEQTCRNAGEPAVAGRPPNQACRDDERKAETTLQQRWSQYPAASRVTCVESTGLGGPPSYVQVLTCLEMAASK
ncbi:hypothetical protein [Bosea lathyri]|uniref:Uncharacterized protein n=1 Tax=Bosea lathyri TaxID=1036778 RepID=A0A1H5VQS7_9HYPH|nr:hypothetical protein [Bosea lathyri]SEF89590.1 hypothetical protein SAMN04488115_102396 [Bosea lathyri]